MTTVLDFVGEYPEVTSLVILALAVFGLLPAITVASAATLAVYLLLSVSFGTKLPAVEAMQVQHSLMLNLMLVVAQAGWAGCRPAPNRPWSSRTVMRRLSFLLQGTFGRTVDRVQLASKLAGKRVEQLVRWNRARAPCKKPQAKEGAYVHTTRIMLLS